MFLYTVKIQVEFPQLKVNLIKQLILDDIDEKNDYTLSKIKNKDFRNSIFKNHYLIIIQANITRLNIYELYNIFEACII